MRQNETDRIAVPPSVVGENFYKFTTHKTRHHRFVTEHFDYVRRYNGRHDCLYIFLK